MKQADNNEKLGIVGVLLATLATYASTFTFGWVYDDPPQIPQSPNLEWGRVGYLFTHHLWASAAPDARFYRPLLTVWFLINKTLFGLNPHWFHVTTVLAHVAATALAYSIARKFFKDAGASLVAAAVFGLHPLQAESASWISSVNDSLAAVLCFASFLAYRRAREKGSNGSNRGTRLWWTLSALAFLLALLMKEVSIVLPGIILVDLLTSSSAPDASSSNPRHPLLTAISIYGLIAVAWLAFRAWILGQAATTYSFVAWKTTILSAPKVFLFDLYRAILPRGLSPHYDLRLIDSPTDPQFLITAAILAIFIFLAGFAARRNRPLWTAFAWLIFPLLPTLNLRWLNQDDFIHDRYTYISMFGVALLAASGYAAMRQKWPSAKLIRPATGAIVAALAFASAIQSQYWANDVSLFSRAVQIAPQNEWAHLNYGAALSSRGKNAEAAVHFVRSYELRPGWRAADFAGFAYQQSQDWSDAEHWYNLAREQNPALASAWFGLAQVRLAQHRPEEAIVYLKKALELQPDAEGYHYLLGTAMEQAGQSSQALDEYKKELQLHPYQTGARKAIERLRRD